MLRHMIQQQSELSMRKDETYSKFEPHDERTLSKHFQQCDLACSQSGKFLLVGRGWSFNISIRMLLGIGGQFFTK
jgi:hypothetical protein